MAEKVTHIRMQAVTDRFAPRGAIRHQQAKLARALASRLPDGPDKTLALEHLNTVREYADRSLDRTRRA